MKQISVPVEVANRKMQFIADLVHEITGYNVQVEYPGYITVSTERGLFTAGTANGEWGIDWYLYPGDYTDGKQPELGITTTLESGAPVEAVADVLIAVIRMHAATSEAFEARALKFERKMDGWKE